jgi:hypothetical protein
MIHLQERMYVFQRDSIKIPKLHTQGNLSILLSNRNQTGNPFRISQGDDNLGI